MGIKIAFDKLVGYFRDTLKHFPDKRTGKNISYKMEDAALGAFAVFFMQSPSFLAHQRTMQSSDKHNNAQSLFKIGAIPSDNQIRDLLDPVAPEAAFPVFYKLFDALAQTKHLDAYRFLGDQLLIPLDGTEYHSSKEVFCDQCSRCEHKTGEVTYHHTAITPVVVHPRQSRVISLPPEFIRPQDGHVKQDCETAAAKRWIEGEGLRYATLKATLLGDDLYSRQPMCETALAQGFHFIFTCKPDSHKTLYADYIDCELALERLSVERRKGKIKDTLHYRFTNQVPLRDSKDALLVNWCEITIVNAAGKATYRNAFVTDHAITAANVEDIVLAGRARWKIENENNNTLKNHGYHLDHNFGHGKQNLSSLLLTLNLLAYLFHTVLDFTDKKYKLLRENLGRRKTFFEHIRSLTEYLFFNSWDDLINFMMKGRNIAMPINSS